MSRNCRGFFLTDVRSWTRGALLLLGVMTVFPARGAASVDDLTGPWVLLVDDYPLAAKTNVARTYHPLQKHAGNPVLAPQFPWEQLNYVYGTVLPNEAGGGYRMWYQSLRTNDPCLAASTQLYATSTNGINWQKPALDQVNWCGSTSNNLYFHGFMTSVMQTPNDPDPARRYKFMTFENGAWSGGWSANGVDVVAAPNNPVFTAGSDSGQTCFDPRTEEYRCYVKNSWLDTNGLRRRAVALAATTNFTNWPASASLVLWPDPVDDRWSTNPIQRTHFYGLSAFAYESGYLGFLWIHRATNLLGDLPGYQVGTIHVELVSSHDGVNWTREEGNRPPMLALGGAGTWDGGMVFTARAPVVEGGTVKVWYGGFKNVHDTSLNAQTAAIGLATLRKDGFASLDAAGTTGAVLTKSIVNAKGQLHVNFQATGSLKVEVLDENNAAVPGYSQADCVPLSGDSVDQAVAWAGNPELPVSPTRLRLRFILQNASVYSFMAGGAASIAAPPFILRQPASQSVAESNAAVFSAAAEGSAPLSYQWQKNNTNLSEGGHYSGGTTKSLLVANAEVQDAASFRCVVTNAYGSVTSAPATLVVVAAPPLVLDVIPLAAGQSANEARAITPDGKYVVGFGATFSTSGTNGWLYTVASKTIRQGIQSSGGAAAGGLTGVGYRIYNGQTQLILDGWSAGWHANFMTTDGGATWEATRRDTSLGSTPGGPLANSMAGTATDAVFATFRHHTSNPGNPVYVGRANGAWPMGTSWDNKGIPSGSEAAMNGVSGTGRAVGYRTVSSVKNNYALDWTGAGTPGNGFFSGLTAGSTAGEALAISAEGTIVFGQSPVSDGRAGSWGYKAWLTTNSPASVVRIAELPNFPDTTGAGGSAAAAFGCTRDGRHAVGSSYRGIERAVLWDTTDSNPARWTVLDLTQLAAANGLLGIFTRLSRAYSIGTNAAGEFVVAGVGTDGVNTRGFVMRVFPPLAPLAHPPLLRVAAAAPAASAVKFQTLANAAINYTLERATNLVPAVWSPVTSWPGTGGEIILTDATPPAEPRFYRVRVQ